MTIQFSIHGSARTSAGAVQRALSAEELGFETLFFADSHFNSLDPFQVMAVCATKTSRLRLGTSVTNMVYRDPTVLAGSAASLNEISAGRAILGLGTGDGPVYGLGRKATPLTRFEAGLRTIRELLQGRSIEVSTGKIALRIGRFPVPVYISAEGPRGLQLAGRVTDGVILGTGFDLRVLQWAREQIARGAAEAGRDPAGIEIMAAGMICVDDDGEKARKIVRRRMANRAHHNFRFTMTTVPSEELAGVQRFMNAFDITRPLEERVDPDLITDYLLQRFSIAGTPQECISRVRELEAAGVRRLMVTPPDTIYNQVMEAWAKQVMVHFPKT